MTDSITRVRACLPETMCAYAESLTGANDTFTDKLDDMNRAVDSTLASWQGDNAAAADARKLAETITGTHISTSVVAVADHYNDYGRRLADVKTALLKIVDFEIPGTGLTVHDDGTVTAPKIPSTSSMPSLGPLNLLYGATLQRQLDGEAMGYEVRIKGLLTEFSDTETEAAAAISAAHDDLTGYGKSPDGAAIGPAVRAILNGRTPLPSDPKQLHEFWSHLTAAEKDALFHHDQYLGNHDGLPTDDRDRYNRIKLYDELTRAGAAQEQVDALVEQHPTWVDHPPHNDPGEKLDEVDEYHAWKARYDDAKNRAKYLPDLNAIHETLYNDNGRNNPDRKLMLLDTQTGLQARAAVAIGNPDTADHVSVTTPGLNTNVHDSLLSMADEATNLRKTAETALQNSQEHRDETVSTIAWIGYDPPQAHFTPSTLAGYLGVAQPGRAESAAPDLAGFYDGIYASHDGSDPQVTAIGHSYGSLTTGLALQQPGHHRVDNMVVYGSPGLGGFPVEHGLLGGPSLAPVALPLASGIQHIMDNKSPADFGLAPGHAFEMTAPYDPIAHLNAFGPSPDELPGFAHMATGATTTPDDVAREGVFKHGEYPQLGDNKQLRTSGYNLAMVVAGLPGKIQFEK